jgi:hypothetical protein
LELISKDQIQIQITNGGEISVPIDQAIINIKHLRLRTYKGFNGEENNKQQDVDINIGVKYRISEAALNDLIKYQASTQTSHTLK